MAELFVNANSLKMPIADESVDMCVTSPPYYGLRDYQVDGQLGLEETPEQYVANMVSVFREVWRVMKPQGTLWLNIGDSYWANRAGNGASYDDNEVERKRAGGHPRADIKPKDLIGIPWMLAFALRADGWYLRSDIIWHKPNPMPESVTDRPTKSHEYIFLLAKQRDYYYDAEAIKEESVREWNSAKGFSGTGVRGGNTGYDTATTNQFNGDGTHEDIDKTGRNKRSVWTVTTKPYKGAHFATFPPDLIEPCIKAGSSEMGVCPECGKPWERVVEKTGNMIRHHWAPGTDKKTEMASGKHGATSTIVTGYSQEKVSVGWHPTCEHTSDPVPAVVLDPFMGSGTTAWVARKLGRSAIGLDLSFKYLHEQARHRLQMDVPSLL